MADFKGFSQVPKTAEADAAVQDTYFSCGVTALQGGNLEEAFLCFSRLPNCPAALFNLTLCCCKVQLYEKALSVLECAEKELSAKAGFPIQDLAVPVELTKHDAQGDAYRMPMAQQTPALFPDKARLRILRLMADLYCELGYEQEFLRILPVFSRKDFQNIAQIKKKFGDKSYDGQ